jgi:hypothetical protein
MSAIRRFADSNRTSPQVPKVPEADLHTHLKLRLHGTIGLRGNGQPLGPTSNLHPHKYRFIDQPGGWLGEKTKVDVPYLTNLRLDPFERTGWPENGSKAGSQEYFGWFKYEFWRFVSVQQQVEKLAKTAIEFPPMQKGASFNLDAVKAKIEAARAAMADLW